MAQDLFRFDTPGSGAGWLAIDDRVMGGVSQSRLRYDPEGHAVFEGVVSLERNGGFASVRSQAGALGTPRASTYVLEVRGDGKRYKLALRTDDGFDGVSYQADFDPPAGRWASVHLAVADFRPTFRGREVQTATPFDPAALRQVGLLIADRQAGPFALSVRCIRVE